MGALRTMAVAAAVTVAVLAGVELACMYMLCEALCLMLGAV